MSTKETNARMSWVAFATAGVTLTAGAFFIAMFIVEVPFTGPYNYGRVNDALSAVGNVMVAVLVWHVSRPAENSPGSRVFVRLVAAASVVAAVSSVMLALGLLALGLLAFEAPTVIAIIALLLQAVWMLWANTSLYQLGVFTRLLSRCGEFVGAGLLVGLLIVGVSALFPWLTVPQVLTLGLGVFIAGGVWLAWPLWFVMLGVQLRKRPAGAGAGAGAGADAAAPATRRRGRRSASNTG
ncbi:hypothetical protein SAMN05216282_10189 [Cryobacterium psychrotolerans]|uniref:DUF4386 domain-containing protein n=1 Tax=Cryobacterium psychrotolerans TaxID=386301 RepID=A0A1G8X560_9MICO|nr:hypothetical protein [Cryobacterium psychrotolerans]TFD83029.1 hypothetical protein E3T56_14970 [Cryobacterium psychrotolerans]SDJ85611.1 hypothetical protein SAMN05216282_10189 [Cryobacterium psychrotolerans]